MFLLKDILKGDELTQQSGISQQVDIPLDFSSLQLGSAQDQLGKQQDAADEVAAPTVAASFDFSSLRLEACDPAAP